MSEAARRRERARRLRAGRIRLGALILLVIALVWLLIPSSAPRTRLSNSHHGATTLASVSTKIPAIESGLEPTTLLAPLSRPVVLPAADGTTLVVAGGLGSGGASAQGVYDVNPITGTSSQIGQLVAPLHDAAGVVLAGKGYIFGGGQATPTASAQVLAGLGTSSSSQASARSLTPLPEARADEAAVTIGNTAYLIGGYSGPKPDATVLATTDGVHYTTVATLPIPVRYAAAAALGGKIYVFGGNSAEGATTGKPVSTVQVIDPAHHHAAVVGQLPEPLTGAAAVTLGSSIYLAGGQTGTPATDISTIWAWDPAHQKALVAGNLMTPVSHAGVTVVGTRAWLVGGETGAGMPISAVQMLETNKMFGTAGQPGAGSPYYGDKLLIADRGNNRLLLLDDTNHLVWTYPSATAPPPPGGFYFPDDAFFTHHGTQIISNQEDNDTLVQLAFPSGKVLWDYGHVKTPGTAPGYLHTPDDAFLLKDGTIVVADPGNCRVLFISQTKKVTRQIGTNGSCVHQPPTGLGSPNGDTPLADGNILVSEINGSWIDEYTPTGHLVWSTHLNIGYPSDPQQLGPDRYLVANYVVPGGFVEFNRAGQILWQYAPPSGTGALNQPSLVERFPSGVLMSNDDYNDRMVAIDPTTQALVWQYGKTGVKGTAPGLLNTPDGFDLLTPNGTFPTHPMTG